MEIYKPGSPDKWYTLVMDHRGTAYAILDENGAEIGRRQYDAFGVILSQTGTWPTDLAYQTNWQTIQIGSKWWGLSAARMYDFATGRLTQRDPLPSNRKLVSKSPGNVLGFYNQTLLGSGISTRYYSKDLARFNGRNPISYSGNKWNLYTFAQNQATYKVDSLGLFPVNITLIPDPITDQALDDPKTPEDESDITKFVDYERAAVDAMESANPALVGMMVPVKNIKDAN